MADVTVEARLQALKIVVSDFHLGKGRALPDGVPNLLEDFHEDEKFIELLEWYSTGPGRRGAEDVELVLNGDILDYLTVDVSGVYPDAMFETIAVEATELIMKGHASVFDALGRWNQTPGCRIRYNLGNHDPAIAWPRVQEMLSERVGPITFGMDAYEFEDVRIEHGHQREVLNQFDTTQMILPAGKLGRAEPIINFPFGCFFVTMFMTRLRSKRSYIGQVVPFRLYLRWAFWNDFWFALWQSALVASFFIKMRFIRHPDRYSRFSKTLKILREIFNPVQFENVARKLLRDYSFRVLVMGHNHEAAIRTYANGKQYVNSGTWTPFTSFDPASLGRHSLRSFVVLEKQEGHPWQPHLREWHGHHVVEEGLNW